MRSASDVQEAPSAPASEIRVSRVSSLEVPRSCRPHVAVFSDEVLIDRVEGLKSSFEPVRMPLLALSFDYDGARVPAAVDDDDDVAPGGIVRDLSAERRARQILEGLGAMDLECLEHYAVSPGVHADYVVRCDGTVHDYCTFAAHVIPQLRSLGFTVEIAEGYEYRTVDVEPRYYAVVEPDSSPAPGQASGKSDWFQLELGIELDGRRISLLPALIELIEQTSDGSGLADLARIATRHVALPVGEHLYLPVPADRLRAILRILAELYEGNGSVPLTALRFPAMRAPAVERLDEVFKRTDTSVRWSGSALDRVLDDEDLPTELDAPAEVRATLRPYQREGLAWLQRLIARGVGGILADDMGLGKTLQTIAHLATEKAARRLTKPALIVSPTSLVGNWAREIAKFAPHLRVVIYAGPDRHTRWDDAMFADVVLTSYPVVCRDEDKLEEAAFYLLILDEAQTIKNDKSRANRVVRALNAEHRLALTGTPVENHLGELWALSEFLNPGLLGDELYFNRFFRVPIEKQKNTERLATLRDMLAPYIIRRTKAEVAKELPPKTELFRPIELRGPQRELYESIRVAAHEEVRKLIKKKGLAASTVPILGALTKLRQVCCDPRLVNLGSEKRSHVGSAKLDLFDELVTQRLAEGHRVLVFSQFTAMLKLIADRLDSRGVRYTSLTGQTVDRTAACDTFEGGEVDVFLISLRAGGTGLTLTSADTVVHYDPWWNPAVQAQATDRAYRIGQKKPVFTHHLYVAGSVEERMLRLQKRKRHVADCILGAADVDSGLSEDDVELLFAPLGA